MGRFVARSAREGVAFLYQYFAPGGRKRFLPIGGYDPTGIRGMPLPKTRDRAAELSVLYRGGTVDPLRWMKGPKASSKVVCRDGPNART